MNMDLKQQKDTIEMNFKHLIKILKNGSDDKLYAFTIPMFEDVMKGQFFIDRHMCISAVKDYYTDLINNNKEIHCESELKDAFKRYIEDKDENRTGIFRCQALAWLLGFLDTCIMSKDKEMVIHSHLKRKKRIQNKKKKEQRKRNKWKKPPSPSLDYKTYDWNVLNTPPPSYAPPLPSFLPNGEKL